MGIELKINYPPNYPRRDLQKSSEFYIFDKFTLRWAKLFPFLDVRVWIQPSTNRSTKIIQKFLVDFILIFEYTIDGRNGSSAVAHIKRKMLIDLRQQREKLEFIGAFFR